MLKQLEKRLGAHRPGMLAPALFKRTRSVPEPHPAKKSMRKRVTLSFTLLTSFSVLAVGCTPYNAPIRIPTTKTATVLSVQEDRDMVTMGSPYLYLEKPDVDWGQARIDATEHCKDWKGFTHAEPVGATRRECMSWVGGDCVRYAIVGDYQCSR